VTPAEHVRKLIEKWLDPDNVNAHYFLLPRDAVEATRTLLLPRNPPNCHIWFQLLEADRRAFRVVYFWFAPRSVLGFSAYVAQRGGPIDATGKAVVAWLRWAAVRQAKSEGLTGRRHTRPPVSGSRGTVAMPGREP
jgi:hypothetical protein